MYSNRTNGTELTSTSSTYRLETNLQLSVTFSIQDEDLVIKVWPYDVINCACTIKMKRCHYMMMQTAQIWRNNKYFRCNILIYIYSVLLKWRALIITPFVIINSLLRRTVVQIVSEWTVNKTVQLQFQASLWGNFANINVQNWTNTPFWRYLLLHSTLYRPPEHWHLSFNLHCVTCHENMISLYAKHNHVSIKEQRQIVQSNDCVSVGLLVNGCHVRICSIHVRD